MKKNIEAKFQEIYYHYYISSNKENYDSKTELLLDLLITELNAKYPCVTRNINRFKHDVIPVIETRSNADTVLAWAIYLEHETVKSNVDVIYEEIRSNIIDMPKIIAPALFDNDEKYLPEQLYLIYMHSFVPSLKERLSVFEQFLEEHKNNKDYLTDDVKYHMNQVKATLDRLLETSDALTSFEIHLDYIPILMEKTYAYVQRDKRFL